MLLRVLEARLVGRKGLAVRFQFGASGRALEAPLARRMDSFRHSDWVGAQVCSREAIGLHFWILVGWARISPRGAIWTHFRIRVDWARVRPREAIGLIFWSPVGWARISPREAIGLILWIRVG